MSNGTQGTKRTERSVVLCGDECCIEEAEYRLKTQYEGLKTYLCEECFMKLCVLDHALAYERMDGDPPLILNENKNPADRVCCGGGSGCGCNSNL